MKLLLKSARIWDAPDTKPVDLLIDDGRIVEVGTGMKADHSLDVDGAIVAPGFVDLHTHLREPGGADAETVETGSAAAAAGGYTAVCAMPNTVPAADSPMIVEMIRRRGEEVGLVDVQPIGAITAGRAGERISQMAAMHASRARVTMFSDDGDPVPNAHLLRRAMEYATMLDALIIEHAEDPSMRRGHMHEGEVSARLGVEGTPAEAEVICVARDIEVARMTGARLHIAHLTTPEAARLVEVAKSEGIRISCEVTPHHLALTDASLEGFDPAFKVAPSLRPAEFVAGLKEAISRGVVDAIATDHAPHAPWTKDDEIDHAPCGMVGLETALGVAGSELVSDGVCTWADVIRMLSINPARIARLPEHGQPVEVGAPANLVVFDPEARWEIDPTAMRTRAENTPFVGHKLTGRVIHTLLRGKITNSTEAI